MVAGGYLSMLGLKLNHVSKRGHWEPEKNISRIVDIVNIEVQHLQILIKVNVHFDYIAHRFIFNWY